MSYLLAGIAVVTALAVVIIWNRQVKRGHLKKFDGRECLANDKLLACFNVQEERRALVLRFLSEIAESMNVSPGVLRPVDELGSTIGPVAGWEYDDDVALVIQKYLENIKSADNPPKTLEDIVRLIR